MKNKTIVRFWRGCFGMGVVVSVSCGKDRVIFDFGAPFSPLTEVYDGVVLPRVKNRVKDAILIGRIPPVDGVFDQQELEPLPIESFQQSDMNTAILICHLHLDHMSEIDKVHPSIPVYIGADGYKLNKILKKLDKETTRDYNPFEYGDTINVGNISVKTFFNDHPCAGTSSFLIKTDDQNILYTGDIRFHGCRYQQAWESIDQLSKEKIDLLIVDSTTTSPSEFIYDDEIMKQYNVPSRDFLKGEVREQDIYDFICNSLKDFDGIGVFNQYPRDVEMLKSMNSISNSINRTTVFEPYYGYILYKMTGIVPYIYYPDVKDDSAYIVELKNICPEVTAQQLKQYPERYILQNSYRNILALIDLDGAKGKYFHLLGEPLVKDCKEYAIMCNFVEKLKWDFVTFINLYSFSHAYPNHLYEVIRTINPTTVVAVHSKHPEKLNPVNSIQVIPEENKNYLLENGKLTKMD